MVLLVDEPDGCFDAAAEPYELLTASDLGIGPELWRMALRYEPFELAMALKPWLLRHLLERDEQVVYLDADIRVFAPLDPVVEALEAHDIVLTPHFLDPVALDGKHPTESEITKAGAYNAGFLALRRGDSSAALPRLVGVTTAHGQPRRHRGRHLRRPELAGPRPRTVRRRRPAARPRLQRRVLEPRRAPARAQEARADRRRTTDCASCISAASIPTTRRS